MRQMLSSPWFFFCLAMFAVWRVTHLLHAEDGPFDVFARFRRLCGQSFFGKLLDCFYCLSVWVAVPAAWFLGGNWPEWILLWLALSGAAILMERILAVLSAWEQHLTPMPLYSEDPPPEQQGEEDGMLRK